MLTDNQSTILLPSMVRLGKSQHITENYVSVPPALTITDETGAVWTLGVRASVASPRGEYAFHVLRNGLETGECASRIERRKGRVRIFTRSGWKQLMVANNTTETKDDVTAVYAVDAEVKNAPLHSQLVWVNLHFDRRERRLPIVTFIFNAICGGGWQGEPIVCATGEWLIATIRPAEYEQAVSVIATLGSQRKRNIPVME